MPYLIDGHNLIGQMTTIRLDDPDDEAKLAIYLRSYSARLNKRFHVVFDGGLPAGTSPLSTSRVKIYFASADSSADNVLKMMIRNTKDGSNWTLVTSDRVIVEQARRQRMRCVNSSTFARQLEDFHSRQNKAEDENIVPPTKIDPKLSKSEVDEWLDIFSDDE